MIKLNSILLPYDITSRIRISSINPGDINELQILDKHQIQQSIC